MFAFAALGLVLASQPSDFPDTPKNHWAYEAISGFKRQGILIGYGMGSKHLTNPGTRKEFAATYYETARNLRFLVAGTVSSFEQIATETPGSQEVRDELAAANNEIQAFGLPAWKRAVDCLERGGTEFAPELRALGEDPEMIAIAVAQCRTTLPYLRMPIPGNALKQFPDVSVKHWAYRALLDLRSLGLIQGYPDGIFGGK